MITYNNFLGYIASSIGVVFFGLLVFALLQWLNIPAGSFVDWVIGATSFGWLMVIVTVPWNVFFEAKQVLAEATTSQTQGIAVDERQIDYVKQVSRLALGVAIALHLLSAVGLYALAAFGISAVGYVSSAATLLLTALRPILRAYQYLAERLSLIRQQVNYPRADVVTLLHQVSQLESHCQLLAAQLDLTAPDSWGSLQQQHWQTTRQEIARLQASWEQFQAKNALEHQQLSQQTQSAIAQLTEDSHFLQQVREIIRFFKSA